MTDLLKPLVRGAYDMQKLRIEIGNRLVANFKSKLGQEPSKKEEEMSDSKAKFMLKQLRGEFKRITDGVTKIRMKSFKGQELISSYAEFALVGQYENLLLFEEDAFSSIKMLLAEIPIYYEFLEKVKGVGPAMASVIITEFDIHKAEYPSSFHRYAGLDVGEDGRGRSRRKEHLVDYEYVDKNGEVKTRKGITFNPFLKTKLVGVLGPSFLRAGKDHKYSKEYYQYRFRLENHVKYKEVSAGHRHNMAIRYMVKRFLIDLHIFWRELEGLPVSQEYSEAKLGMKHKEV